MPECANCGRHVTPAYHRVFADNNGTLHDCQRCTSKQANRNPHRGESHFTSDPNGDRS